jgi:hypothetical protein
MAKNTTRFIMSWVYGILVLILLIFLINIISYFVAIPITTDLVHFVNSNIILLIIISFLFFLGSLFYYIGFPINLLFPIADGIGGALVVYFIINLIVLLDKYAGSGIGNAILPFSWIFSVVIFIIILIFGYISIIPSFGRTRHYNEEDYNHRPLRKRVVRRRISR